MAHGFEDYRFFISAPGDLEPDRTACQQAICDANENIAMPAKVLLIPFGLRDNDQIAGSRAAVSDNVRWSSYFVQIFQDDWGPRDLFRKLFLLAIECRDDPSLPMRDVVVCLRDAPQETNAEILAFRRELDERQDLRVIRYSRPDQLQRELTDVCNGWARTLAGDALAARAGTTVQDA
jgi:hypothetical protein